jgi:hypothetical protein
MNGVNSELPTHNGNRRRREESEPLGLVERAPPCVPDDDTPNAACERWSRADHRDVMRQLIKIGLASSLSTTEARA